MEESLEKNIQVDSGFELPHNTSVLNVEDLESHKIKSFKNPRMQFVIGQMASLVMPVAPMVENKGDHYSVDSKIYHNYDNPTATDIIESTSNKIFMNMILNDTDHWCEDGTERNYEKGVFYDFDVADFDDKLYLDFPIGLLPEDPIQRSELLFRLTSKINYFKSVIGGDGGLKFVESVINKAEYNDRDNPAVKVQKVLLSRCAKALDALTKI